MIIENLEEHGDSGIDNSTRGVKITQLEVVVNIVQTKLKKCGKDFTPLCFILVKFSKEGL